VAASAYAFNQEFRKCWHGYGCIDEGVVALDKNAVNR